MICWLKNWQANTVEFDKIFYKYNNAVCESEDEQK